MSRSQRWLSHDSDAEKDKQILLVKINATNQRASQIYNTNYKSFTDLLGARNSEPLNRPVSSNLMSHRHRVIVQSGRKEEQPMTYLCEEMSLL